MTKRYAIIAFLVVTLALFFGLQFGVLGANQGGTAHGEQGANIALAEGFVQNDLDFFHPQTKALNYQNGDFAPETTGATGITAAHFPIHAYIPAVICKATTCDLQSTIQWYNIMWGFIGLYFIYLLSLRITNHIGKSLFIIAFVGTAPIFAFYQSNFLPAIPSLSIVIAGIYYVYRFQSESILKHAWLGLGLITFACLSSPDFILYLIPAVFLILYQLRSQSKLNVKTVLISVLFSVPIVLDEFWYYHLRSRFGSQFASIFQEWSYDQSAVNTLFGSWKMHYFTVFQTVVFSLVLIIFIIQRIQAKRAGLPKWRRYQILILCLPPVAFLFISPYQSYYSDVFLLKFGLIAGVLAMIFIVDKFDIAWFYRYPKIGAGSFVLLLLVLLSEGNWTQTVRHEKNRTSSGSAMAFTFRSGDELLLKHGVKASDTLNVVVPKNWGIGQEVLGYLNHTGIIREIPTNGKTAKRIPKGHFVVCHIDERHHLHNHFKTNFNELGDNGSIVLSKAID